MADFASLEARVEADRADLVHSLDALGATVAPDNLKQQIGATAEAYGGELGRQAWSAARDNPAAFTLVGAGLGLLLTGAGTRSGHDSFDAPFKQRVAKADTRMKQEMTGMIDPEPKASRLRAALENGLEHLPDAARARVLKARSAALDAQEKLEAEAERAARKARTFAHEQPLAVGALALGVGALVGALIPGTRREDEIMGARRDALMNEAQQVLKSEMDKLNTRAHEALDQRPA